MIQIHNLSERNSLFSQFLAEIRDEKIQKDRLRFRRNLERFGELFAYEISKELDYEMRDVQTPLGVAHQPVLAQQPVLATILRAGLPLHQGMLNMLDQAGNAYISASRKYDSKTEFHIELGYLSTPNPTDKVLIINDPMLASGASMAVAYETMLKKGTPKHVHLVSVLASQKGVDYIREHIKADNVTLWVGAIDPETTEKMYIVPGLGDAGDLAFGPKME
ncbi:MAG: uracil phosphoribosyltransferase [Mangrovibacterium sp.]